MLGQKLGQVIVDISMLEHNLKLDIWNHTLPYSCTCTFSAKIAIGTIALTAKAASSDIVQNAFATLNAMRLCTADNY